MTPLPALAAVLIALALALYWSRYHRLPAGAWVEVAAFALIAWVALLIPAYACAAAWAWWRG